MSTTTPTTSNHHSTLTIHMLQLQQQQPRLRVHTRRSYPRLPWRVTTLVRVGLLVSTHLHIRRK